ncbi:unnamed protein product, partial [Rotaria sordida]
AQLLLKTSDHLSVLDLIEVRQEIISTQINNSANCKHYNVQLTELDLSIVNLMRQEFG